MMNQGLVEVVDLHPALVREPVLVVVVHLIIPVNLMERNQNQKKLGGLMSKTRIR